MFGTNELRKQHLGDGFKLHMQSLFSTIQGEGPYAGRPAIFLRLAGCNLRCHFCDTDFESKDTLRAIDDIIVMVGSLAEDDKEKPTTLVVVTGGEPFLQNIYPLCKQLCEQGFDVQIETAGTLWIPGFEDLVVNEGVTIVCSPKAGKVHDKIAQFCQDWKYLIRAGEVDPHDGLPSMSTQIIGKVQMLARPPRKSDTVWLQPCEEYDVKLERKIDISGIKPGKSFSVESDLTDQKVTSSVRDELQSRKNVELARDLAMKFNYRISLQIHKVIGLP